MINADSANEITPDCSADSLIDGTDIDGGYNTESEDKKQSEGIVKEQKIYPDNCLRFDLVCCATDRGIKLNKCYGEFYAKQVTAITGPPSCGRSTLLKILAGVKVKNSKGRIKVGNVDRTTKEFKGISSFVPHHCIISNLTVKETLRCSAIACCPPKFTDHERNRAIIRVLELLLSTDIIHRKVYDLTLVEQRILCLAAEYLRSPRFVFIQDPLSGLSSLHQLLYLSRVRLLALEGVAVVLCIKTGLSSPTLHYIDNLYVMSKGQCVYSGAPDQLPKYFTTNAPSPAETFTDIHQVLLHCSTNDTRHQVENNAKRCRRPITGPENHASYEPKPVSFLQHTLQGFSLCTRYSIALARQMRAVALRLVYNTFIGILMGSICFEVGLHGDTARENAGYIFSSIIFLFVGALVNSARRTNRYMCIYQRERFNRWYSSFSFYLAKMLAELPLEIIMSVPFASITYFMAGNPATLIFFTHIALCVITACMGHVFGVFVVAVSQKFEIQQAVASIYVTVNMVTMGYIFRVKHMPMLIKWVATLSPFHLLFKSFYINIYNSLDPLYCPYPPLNCSQYAPNLLYLYGYEGQEFHFTSFWYLVAHLAVLHTASFMFITARGRWFDTQLPVPHYNKSATVSVSRTSIDLADQSKNLSIKEGIWECLKGCIKVKPYKPMETSVNQD